MCGDATTHDLLSCRGKGAFTDTTTARHIVSRQATPNPVRMKWTALTRSVVCRIHKT
ncbi:hypothetical protein MHPYR_200065 [uncultured Mycobacterium sp.]|uniref:Uncharacterized protein n=1 Tax=uncultured Mycobacterium sp. TaxID=171292 RepID=A0A1Y5PCH7_9MYCO|nr:hypothetical protein MHPYR_200065 [uncultured Mycobacterium sp.]